VTTGTNRILVTARSKLACLTVWQDQLLAFGSWDDYDIEVWDLLAAKQVCSLPGHLGAVRAMACTGTGLGLLTGSWDGTVRMWHLKSAEQSRILTRHPDSVYALALAPDGSTVASGGTDGTIKLVDLDTRQERATLKGHAGTIWSMAFSSDGKLLVSGGEDQTVRLWRAASDAEVTTTFATPAR
jgi:WD40 repeat protein